MAKCGRYALRILGAIGLLLLTTSPVAASVDQPSDLEINSIVAYENTREDGDQLYLIGYYVDFELGEGESYEDSIDELFIFRLLDADDNEITSATPYPYYNQGYESGVVAFYLEADDAPTYGASLSVELSGNPLVDWDGDPPSTTSTSISWNTGTIGQIQELVSAKIIYLASQLEQDWSVEMTMAASGMTILSETGASYFLRAVPYLTEVAPYATGQYTFTPSYPSDKPSEDTYANTLVEALEGTIFDLSGPARSWGISAGALAAGIYYPLVVAFFVLLASKHKMNKGTMFLAWPFVIAGTFIGVPLVVTIVATFITGSSIFIVFYKGAP